MITGIEEQNNVAVSLYPNPFSTEATLLVGNSIILNNATLIIYDMLGKEVRTITGINSNSISIQKSALQSGVYFYRLNNGSEKVANGRFIIE